MGWVTSGVSIRGKSYSNGTYVTLNSGVTHYSSADGSNGSTSSRSDHYFYGRYDASWAVAPYHVSPTSGQPYGRYYKENAFPYATYTVSYNANGGSGAPGSQTKTYGSTLTLSSTKPTRTGHTFKNWNTASGGGGTSYNPGGSYTSNSAVTLYAQWTANTYKITYNANGGSGAPAAQTYTYASSGTVNLSSTVPTKTGYTFLGWSTSSTATAASYSAGQAWSKSNASNYTLYAVWQVNTYTITYNANGGENAPAAQSYTYAASGTITLTAAIPIRDKYEFKGWAESAIATSPTIQPGDSWNKSTTKNVTLYAVWEKLELCTLVYDGNGIEINIPSQEHRKTYVSTLSSEVLERKGYHFSGWATTADAARAKWLAGGLCVHDDFSDGDIVTLYAVWRKDVNIHFKYNE